MPQDEVIDQNAETGADPALNPETDPTKTGTEAAPGATEAPEKVAETDEQKNERVQREAKEQAEKRSRGVQKRIDELTADKHAERKRADDLAATNARILALLEGKSAESKPAAVQGEPTRDQFDDYETYVRANAVWHAEQRANAIVNASTKTFLEQQQRTAAEQSERAVVATYLERQKEAAKSIPDFAEVMGNADVAVPNGVYSMIMRLPDGPLIAYRMAKNPDLAKQFYSNPSEMHGVLLGQISAALKVPQKASNAPAPGKPAATTSGSSTEPPSDPEKYRAWADKHLK